MTENSQFLSILSNIEQDEKSANRSKRNKERSMSRSRIPRYLFWTGLGTSFFLAAAFTIWALNQGPDWSKIAALGSLGIGYLTVLSQPLVLAWFYRQTLKEIISGPFAAILRANVTQPMTVDGRHLPLLIELPRIELELGLLSLKIEAQFLEKRIGWVVGAIDKVGVIPGCLAVLVGLQKMGEGADWVTAIAWSNIGLYGIGALANVYVVRYQRMIGLTELAIKQQELRDKALNKDTTSPATKTDTTGTSKLPV